MKVPTNLQSFLVAVATASLLSACGSSGISGAPNNATMNQTGDIGISVPVITGGTAAYPFAFSTYGLSPITATTELRTDTKLIVQVTADAATRNQGTPVPTNFAAEYKCAIFKITLQVKNGNSWMDLGSKITQPLKVAGTDGCTGSVPNERIDFSAFMTSGHGNVKIKVESLKTDFYCILYNKCLAFKNQYGYWSSDCYWASPSNMAQYACPVKTIYTYHTVNGSLQVEVNGTQIQ